MLKVIALMIVLLTDKYSLLAAPTAGITAPPSSRESSLPTVTVPTATNVVSAQTPTLAGTFAPTSAPTVRLQTTTPNTSVSGSSTLPPTQDTQLSSEQSPPQVTLAKSGNAALYAGVVSGAVILFAIGAVIYSTRYSERNFFTDALESVSDSLYNDSLGGFPGGKVLPILSPRANATAMTGRSSTASSASRSRIKPAAITLRRKADQESSGSVSTLDSPRQYTGSQGQSQFIHYARAEDYDHLGRMEDGPDLIASRVLTYNDAAIRDLATSYPEFESNPYADTAWSVDGLTLEEESFVARPRRWQDE
jgi:hypothetical protein